MPTNLDFASRRIWIDLSLAAAGAVCAWQGLYAVAAPLVLFALVAPALRLRQRRRGEALLSLVPAELADAHRALAAAAALPGVMDGPEALVAADDAVLETAVSSSVRHHEARRNAASSTHASRRSMTWPR